MSTQRIQALLNVASHPRTGLAEAHTAFGAAQKMVAKQGLGDQFDLQLATVGISIAAREVDEAMKLIAARWAQVAPLFGSLLDRNG